jgi:hypothetical protein
MFIQTLFHYKELHYPWFKFTILRYPEASGLNAC